VKYFSGAATHEKEIDVPAGLTGPGTRLRLDLGEVRQIAEVRLSGTNLGTLWKKPFALDITPAVKPGKNRLEIRVTNLWSNRLIGDQQLPPEKRLTRTNIRKFTKDSPLMPSGLPGPVEIHPLRWVQLR